MNDFIFSLTSGLCWGAIIALIALGYTLVYGIIKLINFAHGEFFMVGAYAGYGLYAWAFQGSALPVWALLPLLLLVSGLAGAAVGAGTEYVAYRPIRGSGRLAALLTAIGVSFFLQNVMARVEDGNPQVYGGALDAFSQLSVQVGSQPIRVLKLAYLPAAALLTLLLWGIVMRTRFGRAMRAVSQDPDAAALMGIDVDRVIRRTFLLGGFLAGVGGTLVALTSTVNPVMGFMPGLKAFVAAVIGGIGSVPGAVVGGLVIGVVEHLVIWAGVPSGYKDVAAFVLLIVVLVVRPQGLLGRREREKV